MSSDSKKRERFIILAIVFTLVGGVFLTFIEMVDPNTPAKVEVKKVEKLTDGVY